MTSKMMWRFDVYITICLAFGLNVLIVTIGDAYAETVITEGNHSSDTPGLKNVSNLQDEISSSNYITAVLEKARTKIKYDTSNFNFSQLNVTGLEDLVIESGGRPVRNFILSTYRSGSNFLADLVTNIFPSTYHTSEPLQTYRQNVFKTPEEVTKALSIVKQILECNYEGLDEYIEYMRKLINGKWFLFNSSNIEKHKTTVAQYAQKCKNENKGELCYNAEFMSRICKLYPFQSIKLLRLRLNQIEEILDETALKVKVILLVRDPRGVMQSRLHLPFCNTASSCIDPSLLCANMISDYVAARKTLQQHPDHLMVVRFEELALQPDTTADRIITFLKTQRSKAFEDFLQAHTTVDQDDHFSTFRVSRNVPYKWTTALDFNYVNEVQLACSDAMKLWGYKMAHNASHMTSKDFNPVDDYTIS